MINDIFEFHNKFNFIKPHQPSLLPNDLRDFRIKFMQEELDEFIDAHRKGDLAGCLDALVDLTYVALGTAFLMNLPFEPAWDAVHKANMLKVRAERAADSKRGTPFDVVKPPGWVPPDIQSIIEEYTFDA